MIVLTVFNYLPMQVCTNMSYSTWLKSFNDRFLKEGHMAGSNHGYIYGDAEDNWQLTTEQKPFHCEFCGKEFKKKGYLLTHIKVSETMRD